MRNINVKRRVHKERELTADQVSDYSRIQELYPEPNSQHIISSFHSYLGLWRIKGETNVWALIFPLFAIQSLKGKREEGLDDLLL